MSRIFIAVMIRRIDIVDAHVSVFDPEVGEVAAIIILGNSIIEVAAFNSF